MEDCILFLIRWLFKNKFSLPGFAGARCAFHNAPILQPSSVAMAYTMTFLICPILAWLPATSLPTQYNFRYAFHVYLPPPQRDPTSLCFKTNKSNWHISFPNHMCLQHGCPKKGNLFPSSQVSSFSTQSPHTPPGPAPSPSGLHPAREKWPDIPGNLTPQPGGALAAAAPAT